MVRILVADCQLSKRWQLWDNYWVCRGLVSLKIFQKLKRVKQAHIREEAQAPRKHATRITLSIWFQCPIAIIGRVLLALDSEEG